MIADTLMNRHRMEVPSARDPKGWKQNIIRQMNNTTLDLMELLSRCPNATVNVQASDLCVFARKLIAETRQEFERERAAIEAGKAETYQEPEAVKAALKISESTLYRWAKSKILVPIWMGGQKRYRQSDIDRLVQGVQE